MPATRTVLFTSPHYAVDYFPAGPAVSDKVAITFTERGWRALDSIGFGGAYLHENGFDVIAFRSDVDRWYQDMPPEALDAASRFLDAQFPSGTRRITYGSSMGGYAALIYARCLHAVLAIAISPQFDAAADWDRRWVAFIDTPMRVFTPSDVAPCCAYVLISDPFDKDAMHVARYREVIPGAQFHTVDVNYCGHPAGPALLQAGLLKSLVSRVLDQDVSGISQRALSRALRSTSNYQFNMALRCYNRNHPAWAGAFIGAALAQRPMDPEFQIKAALIKARQGLHDVAISHAATAVALKPDHPHMAAALAYLLDRRDHRSAAIHYFNQAIALLPGTRGWIDKRDALVRQEQAASGGSG